MSLQFSKANAKLKKLVKMVLPSELQGLKVAHIVSFALPAFKSADGFKVCPGAGACAAVCYARQGAYTWKAATTLRENNLEALRGMLATHSPRALAVALLAALPKSARVVRVHDSGDFFSQSYLDAWCLVASKRPGIIFYAYTKSFDLDFSAVPSNLRITFSEGSMYDAELDKAARRWGFGRSRIFATAEDRNVAGYIDGDSSDLPAIMGEDKIGFVYHGVRKLTPAQIKAFGATDAERLVAV